MESESRESRIVRETPGVAVERETESDMRARVMRFTTRDRRETYMIGARHAWITTSTETDIATIATTTTRMTKAVERLGWFDGNATGGECMMENQQDNKDTNTED